MVSAEGRILERGVGNDSLTSAVTRLFPDGDYDEVDAAGKLVMPGFIDLHAHGSWGAAYDDGPEAVRVARAGHLWHGTTRQVLSLITNPLDAMIESIQDVRGIMGQRPDILGVHLEGPFISPERKGAHDPNCLIDPSKEAVERLLEASDGIIRQITIAPELEGGLAAVAQLVAAGVIPAVGHTQADYEMTQKAFDAGSTLVTHIFNAMNGLAHRAPGPIPAAIEDRRVTCEFINDGFHVQDPMCRLAFEALPHRIAFVTDAMAATGCPDGPYLLGKLDVNVVDGHARLVSNGAIAGSTLTLDVAVRRGYECGGLTLPEAVECATLTPARVLGLDRPNSLTGAPLGLLAPGYAADLVMVDPADFAVKAVWSAGHRVR